MIPLTRCIFCLAKGAGEIRFDKKSRPYIFCRLCMTRAFVRSLEALRGLALAPKLLEAALERRATDENYRRWVDGEIAAMVAHARSATPTTAQTGLPATMVEPYEEVA